MQEQHSTRKDKSRKGTAGSVFVEFALGFMAFIMLMFGVFEGMRLIWVYTTLSHAAREGARFAIVHGHQGGGSTSAIEAWVEGRAPGLDPADVTVAATWSDASKAGSSTVAVQVSYPIQLIAAPLLFGRNSMTLSYTAQGVVAE